MKWTRRYTVSPREEIMQAFCLIPISIQPWYWGKYIKCKNAIATVNEKLCTYLHLIILNPPMADIFLILAEGWEEPVYPTESDITVVCHMTPHLTMPSLSRLRWLWNTIITGGHIQTQLICDQPPAPAYWLGSLYVTLTTQVGKTWQTLNW